MKCINESNNVNSHSTYFVERRCASTNEISGSFNIAILEVMVSIVVEKSVLVRRYHAAVERCIIRCHSQRNRLSRCSELILHSTKQNARQDQSFVVSKYLFAFYTKFFFILCIIVLGRLCINREH